MIPSQERASASEADREISPPPSLTVLRLQVHLPVPLRLGVLRVGILPGSVPDSELKVGPSPSTGKASIGHPLELMTGTAVSGNDRAGYHHDIATPYSRHLPLGPITEMTFLFCLQSSATGGFDGK